MSNRRINILLSAVSLILGGGIYLLFRESSVIAYLFREVSLICQLRAVLAPFRIPFLQFYLADFLWGFSLSCGLFAIHTSQGKRWFILPFFAFGFGCLWEILQYRSIVFGTGDIWDIVMYLLASTVSAAINIIKERKV